MRTIIIASLAFITLLLAGCRPGEGQSVATAGVEPPAAEVTAATTEATSELPMEATATHPVDVGAETGADATMSELAGVLGNLTYTGVLPDQPVTLTDGIGYYDESAGSPYVRLVDQLIAAGDLDGDGTEDAVAFLVDYSSGSADFVFLAAVLSALTEPAPVEALMIGDRTPVKSLSIEGDEVIVEFIGPGPDDVACCPTLNTRKRFALEEGRMVERSSEELGSVSLADLDGAGWRLLDLNLDQEPALLKPPVTLRFEAGRISGSAGCNDYNSDITVGEAGLPQSLAVGPIAATRTMCAEPEMLQETNYLARLGKVVAWRYAFGYLSLTYKLDDAEFGELLFAPDGS